MSFLLKSAAKNNNFYPPDFVLFLKWERTSRRKVVIFSHKQTWRKFVLFFCRRKPVLFLLFDPRTKIMLINFRHSFFVPSVDLGNSKVRKFSGCFLPFRPSGHLNGIVAVIERTRSCRKSCSNGREIQSNHQGLGRWLTQKFGTILPSDGRSSTASARSINIKDILRL